MPMPSRNLKSVRRLLFKISFSSLGAAVPKLTGKLVKRLCDKSRTRREGHDARHRGEAAIKLFERTTLSRCCKVDARSFEELPCSSSEAATRAEGKTERSPLK
jgi:hypothetical protein